MKRFIAVLLAAALAGCATSGQEKSPLQYYDWLEVQRGKFNLAIDQLNHALQVRLEQEISAETQKRFDEVVNDLANSPDPDRRGLAAFALGLSHRPEAAAYLSDRLVDPDKVVRANILGALGYLRPAEPPLDKVYPHLSDPDPHVRLAALFALKEMLPPGMETPILDRVHAFLDDVQDEARNEAVLVLKALRRPESMPLLIKKGLRDPSFLVRSNAALALAEYGADAADAVPVLIERLRDSEASVIRAVYFALTKITGRQDADRSYSNWREWYDEIIKLFEYACAKCPEVVRPFGGTCPQCGLRLEPRSKSDPNYEYYCPKDPDVILPKWGKCPKCKGSLVPRRKEGPK